MIIKKLTASIGLSLIVLTAGVGWATDNQDQAGTSIAPIKKKHQSSKELPSKDRKHKSSKELPSKDRKHKSSKELTSKQKKLESTSKEIPLDLGKSFVRELFMHAHQVSQENIAKKSRPSLKQMPEQVKRHSHKDVSVGIVGGGMTGLYAALLLQELGINYHILEASGGRQGGRVYTHYFNNQPHQYAELGAMRFPDNFMQSRLFSFWDYLNKSIHAVPNAREIPRIPYIMKDKPRDLDAGNLYCFNNKKPVTVNQANQDNSLLGFDDFFEGRKWDYFKENGKLKSAQTLMDNALNAFKADIGDVSIAEAWKKLKRYDRYSARAYLEEIGDKKYTYPSRIVDYMETVLTYTGIFDMSFIEMIFDQLSFTTKEWYALEGGTSRITEEMLNRIPAGNISFGANIYKLLDSEREAKLYYRHGEGTLTAEKQFDRIIVTLPFGVLRFLDIPDDWSAGKLEAIRRLKSTNAVKIALGFKSRFWEREGPYSKGMKGGQSDTDLPVRSIVYPSFGIGEEGPAYLLGSYCWEVDADKFSHVNQADLLDVALKSVEKLHGPVVYDEYLGHGTSVVWNKESLAGGAFGYFSAGQFGQEFEDGKKPEGRFHFGGEHLDAVHYWIAGSFDSAFRTVWEILIAEKMDTKGNLEKLFKALGGGDIFPPMIPHNASPESIALAKGSVQ